MAFFYIPIKKSKNNKRYTTKTQSWPTALYEWCYVVVDVAVDDDATATVVVDFTKIWDDAIASHILYDSVFEWICGILARSLASRPFIHTSTDGIYK